MRRACFNFSLAGLVMTIAAPSLLLRSLLPSTGEVKRIPKSEDGRESA
jgi:hypothetical protein